MENYNQFNTNQNTLPISKESLEQILKEVVIDTKITDLSIRILSYICLYLNDNDVINDSVSENLNICHRNTIAKCWKNLIDSGWLVRYPKINPTTGKTLKGFIYRIPKNKLTYDNSHNVEQNQNNTKNGDHHE
jgi:predicted transcriptional regulator